MSKIGVVKKPISERISIFERPNNSPNSSRTPTVGPQKIAGSKNISALRSAFGGGSESPVIKSKTSVTSPSTPSKNPKTPVSTKSTPIKNKTNNGSNKGKSSVNPSSTMSKTSPTRKNPLEKKTSKPSVTKSITAPLTPKKVGISNKAPVSRTASSSLTVQISKTSSSALSSITTTASSVVPSNQETKTSVEKKFSIASTTSSASSPEPIRAGPRPFGDSDTDEVDKMEEEETILVNSKNLNEFEDHRRSSEDSTREEEEIIEETSNTINSTPLILESADVAIETEVINRNYIKNQNDSSNNSYWTNQALNNDNSRSISEALKLDLEFKDEKISALNKELEEINNGGASEEELTHLKKQKNDLDMRLKDQEEELDDLAGQVQMLEQAKVKLEMAMAAQKKEHRREINIKDEELEDARAVAQKKVKALEQQLENEHEERLRFVREKHDLETRIMNLQELASRSTDEEQVLKLKRDLKKTRALLKDAQCMADNNKSDSSSKIVLRQLRNQLEDSEFAKAAALKARQNTEMELTDVQTQLDDVMRSKSDLEDKLMRISREKTDALTQLEDNEEELQDVMKKYKAAVSQLSVDQITIAQQSSSISELEEERNRLKESLSELNQRIDNLESDNLNIASQSRQEIKIRELESKYELEQTTRTRMESQIARLKEVIEKMNLECDSLRNKELSSQDQARKLQRQLRDQREEYNTILQKEMEVQSKKNELEKNLEVSEAEVVTIKNDLKIALKRIEDLQVAIQGDLSSDSDSLNSDMDSDSSDEGMDTFFQHHRRAVSVQRDRESMSRDIRSSMVREMTIPRSLEPMKEEPEETMSITTKVNIETSESESQA